MSTEPISSATPVSLTVTQLGIVLAVLMGGGWAIMQMTTVGLRDDVATIRQSLQSLQNSDKEGSRRLSDTDLKLSLEIGGLKSAIGTLDNRLVAFGGKLDGYDRNVALLAGQMSEFQREFFRRNSSPTPGNTGRQ